MKFADQLLPEFDHEMANTRKILEVVPDSLLDWKAADSLNSIAWVASHLADTLSWMDVLVKEISFDVAPVDGPPHQSLVLDSTEKILKTFDENLVTARARVADATDEELQVGWTLMQGGQSLQTMPRAAWIKSLFVNHIVHHRAFLICYLRINGVECPPMYE